MSAVYDASLSRSGTATFVAAAAATCAANITWWMQPLLLHELTANRGLGEVHAGIIISIEMMMMASASMLSARLATGHSLLRIATTGVVLALIGSGLTLFTSQFWWLAGARALTGVGAGLALTMANAAATTFPDPDRAFARIAAINIISGIAIVGLMPIFSHGADGPTPFGVMFGAMLIMAPFVLFLPRALRLEAPVVGSDAQGDAVARGRSNIWVIASATFAIGVASGMMWVYYAIIGARIGMDITAIDNSISMAIFSALGATILAALLGGRAGRVVPIAVGLFALSAAVFALSGTPTVTMFRVATALNVSAIYFITPYLFGAGAAQDTSGQGAIYVGGAFYATGAVAPTLGSVIATSVGIGIIGVMTSFIAVLALIAIWRIERRASHLPRVQPSLSNAAAPGSHAEVH